MIRAWMAAYGASNTPSSSDERKSCRCCRRHRSKAPRWCASALSQLIPHNQWGKLSLRYIVQHANLEARKLS